MFSACPLCWLQMMARLALFALEFLVLLWLLYTRTVLAFRARSPR
jgi:disulfide bond formation protein DsbB